QAGIVLAGQNARQIVVLQRLGKWYPQKAQPLLCRHLGHWCCRLARDQHRGRDLANPQLLQRLGLLQIDFLDLDVQAAEHVPRRELGPAASSAEVDGLAGQLLEGANVRVGAHCNVHLLPKELADVDDFTVEIANLVAAPKSIEQIGRRDAQVNALQKANIADVLAAALADEG